MLSSPNPLRIFAAVFAGLAIIVGGCGSESPSKPKDTRQEGATVPPNEAGAIPVLAYHRVGGDLSFAPDLTISAREFRAELEYLRNHDYYPVNFRDLVRGDLDVPPGKNPVVLTFDDSSDSQFTLVRRDGQLVPDPDGAVGVLLDFHADHPDWPLRGTFFPLPGVDPPNNLFGQADLAARKLRFLLDRGFELGLHTLWHANLATVSDQEIARQLALNVAELERHTGRRGFTSLALPYGVYPKNEALLRTGRFEARSYRIEGAAEFEYPGAAARPPWIRGFDPQHIPRIPTGDDAGESRPILRHLAAARGERYLSDGNRATVSVPRSTAPGVDGSWVQRSGRRLLLTR